MAIFERKLEETRGETKPNKLDPEMCFRLWSELGSLQRVVNHLADLGYVNPATARPFSMGGIRASAFVWMFNHPDEAYQCVLDAGSRLTRNEFNQILIWRKRTRTASTSGMYTWLQKNGLLDPDGSKGYREIYEGKFRRLHRGGITDFPQVSESLHSLPEKQGGSAASPGAAQPSAAQD
jgi:hypothetical protein